MNTNTPITESRYLLPLILVTSLFFLWAIGVNLNDILIPHLKKAFDLSDFQSSLIQAAFFGGYFIAALPAGWFVQRIGYNRGILTGLFLCAAGAFLFIPAATVRIYWFFLFALFVMACGQCVLEVAANPYVTVLGPPESSERRLNLAQSLNAVGAVLTPFLGAAFILSGIQYTPSQMAMMSTQQQLAYRISEANMVKVPYLVISAIFLCVAALIYLLLVREEGDRSETVKVVEKARFRGVWAYPHLVRGMLAQFFYVGAQVGVASFVIRFAEHATAGGNEKMAAHYLQLHLIGFMLGRFAGCAIMKNVPAPRVLVWFTCAALVCATVALFAQGPLSIWAIVLLGFFHSIMFPTIFALSLKNLGPYTKLGASLLVMSTVGGAIFPALMGIVSDALNIQKAFAIPLICYIYILFFALTGYKVRIALDPSNSIGVASGVTE
jgi:MFS transporter, FHS family, L-fucose permease